MKHSEYLVQHHIITETAIGTAILEIKDKNYGNALRTLDNCRKRIDKLEFLVANKKEVDESVEPL